MTDYSRIDRPFDNLLSRDGSEPSNPVVSSSSPGGKSSVNTQVMGGGSAGSSGSGGSVAEVAVKNPNAIDDLWIRTQIRSENWKPRTQGFMIDGRTGKAEFANVYVSGTIESGSGSMGGWVIESNQLVSSDGNLKLQSASERILVGDADTPDIGTGIFIGKDDGTYKFRAGDPNGAYMLWDGSMLALQGGIVTSLGQGSDLSILGWQSDLTFSSTNQTTVAWSSGTLRFHNGVTYSITGSSTGVMAALTYIYFDSATSTTTLQVTTTATTAVGPNKVIVAVAKNNAETGKDATFQVFGGAGGVQPFITADNIAANTITANEIAANTITASELSSNLIYAGAITLQTNGHIKGGQTAYDAGTGFFLGYSGSAYKFSIGDSAGSKLTWDGATLEIQGGNLIAPGIDTALSLLTYTHDIVFTGSGTDQVNWGAGTIRMSNGVNYSISSGGTGVLAARTFIYFDKSVSETVLQTTTTIADTSGTNKILLGWAEDGTTSSTYQIYGGRGGVGVEAVGVGDVSAGGWVFPTIWTLTDADTVSWGAATLTTSNGDTHAIGAGNTGNMVAKTFIYLDTNISTTALQTSTTATDAVGTGKLLVAIAKNGTVEPTLVVVNDDAFSIDASSIVAGSITANEIAASTITAGKLSISTLSSITADIGTITAGSITGVTITGGTVRTASSGTRVEMSGANSRLDVYSGSTRRMSLDADSLEFFNSSGTNTASITADTTYGLMIDMSFSSYQNVMKYNGTYGLYMMSGSTNIAKFYSTGLAMQNSASLLTYDVMPQDTASVCGAVDWPYLEIHGEEIYAHSKLKLPVGTNMY